MRALTARARAALAQAAARLARLAEPTAEPPEACHAEALRKRAVERLLRDAGLSRREAMRLTVSIMGVMADE